eukprot:m.136739 g.136739  ORF g.136739 m.136739 type:complete len:487 (-) comp10878_c0_seq1:62-1522(-)
MFSKKVKRFSSEYATTKRDGLPDSFTAMILTWNVGNAPPPEDMTELLGTKEEINTDIIVIGLQECSYSLETPKEGKKKMKGADKQHKSDFLQRAHKLLGEEYESIVSVNLGEMVLGVFVAQHLAEHVYHVSTQKEATGILRVVANKGGIGCRFCIGDTTFGVISSHLNAHAGEERKLIRHQDTREILKGTKTLSDSNLEITTSFHHVFWLGDLNYRLNLAQVVDAVPETHEEKFKLVSQWVEEENWEKLYEADELRADMEKGKVFFGFKEGAMSFHPTFKVVREKELKFLEQRVPAYCDRILWKSMPNVSDDIVQDKLEPLTRVATSDHKPVRGFFTVKIKKNTPTSEKLKLSLKFLQLECSGLDAKDIGGTSDPYVMFASPDTLIKSKKAIKTTVKPTTLSPQWNEADIPIVPLQVTSIANVQESVLSFVIYDKDITSSDDLLGAAEISLSEVGLDKTIEFTAPVHRHGKISGEIKGSFLLTLSM